MRINDINYGLYSYKNQVNRTNSKDASKQSTTDNLNLSTTGQEISQAVHNDQVDRQQRVQQLKQQIADGTYTIDANKVAKSLSDFWKK